MTNVRRTLTKVAVAVMLAGSLATAGSGVAGAAQGTGGHHPRHASGNERRKLCQLEERRLAFSQHLQSQFAAQTVAFTRPEAKAAKAGNTHLAAYWAQVVSHRDAFSASEHTRLQARTARDAKVHALVNGKCL
jgi:hypothetical protein